MENADKLVEKTLEIIHFLRPKMWWIENPRTGLLKTRQVMDKIPHVDIDYCQFCDWGYQKPTRFWGSPNIVNRPSVTCDFQTCPNLVNCPQGRKRHQFRLGGYKQKISTRQKGRIPENVVAYLLKGLIDRSIKHRDRGRRKWVPVQGDQRVKLAERDHSNPLGGEPNCGSPEKTVFLAPRLLRPINSYSVGSCNRVSQ